MSARRRERGDRRIWLGVALLAVLAYLPALRSSPGRMPADTKLYLYLDPARLISDAPWTFDARQFAGWVPHQVIAYLWPQGPWFWLGDVAGLPDWVTHRLWIGTLFLAAGGGVLWAGRKLGLGLWAALAAALVYQLAPYLLPYVSRTSAMLLPWAGLGWLIGLTVMAATRTTWRHAALAALVVGTVGAVNPTALLMIAPGPVLWLLLAAGGRQITWSRAAATAARIGGLSLAVSSWWITMVVIQGRRGADVLAFSESLESVSYTSTSPEVWRGLGYWLTYVRDAYAPTTTAGRDYMVSGRLIATGFVLLLVGLTGLVVTRWRSRAFAVGLVVTGVIVGVGVHPFDDPSPLMDLAMGDGTSGPALALRSSTRAVPLLVLGLAFGAGALVDSFSRVRIGGRVPAQIPAFAVVGLLAVANLPVLTGANLVDPAIDRDEDPPEAWTAATDVLDATEGGGRVLQVPGAEFGAFRWGYTVDPPLPGLTDRPLVTRDLLPLGSPQAMDLLFALDDRFQAGVVDAASIAPVARLLGADTIWVPGDAAFDRFRTPRPELTHDLFQGGVDGLGAAVAYGPPAVNQPDVAMIDEQAVSDDRIGQPVPPVELVPVVDPLGVIRAKDEVVVVAGSGDGVIDAAAVGLVDGTELIRYAGSLAATDQPEPGPVDRAIVTDSNRQRAHHWRGSQDVVGFTEDGDPATDDVLREDVADERLDLFPASDGSATVAVQEGPVRARASAYGEPFAYRPEDRAVMAIDGDPATAWRVADRAPAEGEFLRLDVAEAVDHITLRQPEGAGAVRHIGTVAITVDDGEPSLVELDERSLQGAGQRVDLEPTAPGSAITITIESVVVPDPSIGPALAAVGFAEADVGLGPTVEVVRVPTLPAVGEAPVSYVFTRQRTRPSDRWRSDPEPTMVRELAVPAAATVTPRVTVRLDQRASDTELAALLGITGATASTRLTGVAGAAGWAATDGDPATAWITPFGDPTGATLLLPGAGPLTELVLTQPAGEHTPITRLQLTDGTTTVDVAVPAADPDGRSTVTLPEALDGDVEVRITGVEPRITLDRRYAEPVVLPAAIAEISAGARTTIPAAVDTGCRDDLVALDGTPVPVRITAPTADLLAGAPVDAVLCAGPDLALGPGTHRLTTGGGSGLQVDRVALAAPAPAAATSAVRPTAILRTQDRLSRHVTVTGCVEGCWLVLGEGYHDAWHASTRNGDLGPPQLVDGGFNGWWIPPRTGPVEVTLRWTAQPPLTVALIISVLAVLACLALAVVDLKRQPVVDVPPPASPSASDRRRCARASSPPSCGCSPPACSSAGGGCRWRRSPPPCSWSRSAGRGGPATSRSVWWRSSAP